VIHLLCLYTTGKKNTKELRSTLDNNNKTAHTVVFSPMWWNWFLGFVLFVLFSIIIGVFMHILLTRWYPISCPRCASAERERKINDAVQHVNPHLEDESDVD